MATKKKEVTGPKKTEAEKVISVGEEVRADIKFSKRATELLGILLIIRLLVVLVITPIQNKTWNRKNTFDVIFSRIK